jgi:hypothetical protein
MNHMETSSDDGSKCISIVREAAVAIVSYDATEDVLEIAFDPGEKTVRYIDHPHIALLGIEGKHVMHLGGIRIEAISEFIKPGIIDELESLKGNIDKAVRKKYTYTLERWLEIAMSDTGKDLYWQMEDELCEIVLDVGRALDHINEIEPGEFVDGVGTPNHKSFTYKLRDALGFSCP